MKGDRVLLSPIDRETVTLAIQEHCQYRDWHLFAVNPRTNHVHLVVYANAKPNAVRDQLKANCTRSLRQQEEPLIVSKTWATGGDTEFIDDEDDLEQVIRYVHDDGDAVRVGIECDMQLFGGHEQWPCLPPCLR